MLILKEITGFVIYLPKKASERIHQIATTFWNKLLIELIMTYPKMRVNRTLGAYTLANETLDIYVHDGLLFFLKSVT